MRSELEKFIRAISVTILVLWAVVNSVSLVQGYLDATDPVIWPGIYDRSSYCRTLTRMPPGYYWGCALGENRD